MNVRIVAVVLVLAVTAGASAAEAARTCYVNPTSGVDATSSGASSSPYRTVNYTLAVAPPSQCTTLLLQPGTYPEHVTITRKATAAEPLVITKDVTLVGDATIAPNTVDPSMPRQAAIGLYDAAYVTISGLVVTNDVNVYCTGSQGQPAPLSSSYCNAAGIDIRNFATYLNVGNGASSHHITIFNNEIRDVKASTMALRAVEVQTDGGTTTAMVICGPGDTGCARRYDAMAIGVYSDRNGLTPLEQPDASEATNHIIITGNDVHHCDTNSDTNTVTAIVLSRNVEHVIVHNNTVHDLTATSVVYPQVGAMSARGERATGLATDAYARPRKVIFDLNNVWHITGVAFFIQSATQVLVSRNTVRRSGIGVQVVTEGDEQGHLFTGGRARQVWVRNNLFRNISAWAIDLGMLAPTYSPIEDVYVTNNTITNILVASTFERFPVVLRQGIINGSAFLNNLILLRWSSGLTLDYLLRREVSGSFPMSMVVNRNLWFVSQYMPGGVTANPCQGALFCTFTLPGYTKSCHAFTTHQAFGDAQGLCVDPQLSGYTLPSTSPAINSGTVSRTPPWYTSGLFGDYEATYVVPETDQYGAVRVQGASIDIGMQERL